MDPILLVDDDLELCQMLDEYLQLEGFEVDQAHDGEQALQRVAGGSYSVIILDVMMPGLNGFDTLKALRQLAGGAGTTPVLMMSARGEEVDRIVGLEIGADDYLPKPCSPRELVARIRAITRRVALEHQSDNTSAPGPIELGSLVIDPDNLSAQLDGTALPLTQTELRILQQLLQAPSQLVTREALSRGALNRLPGPFDRSLDMHLSNLRRKLNQAAPDLIRIQTVRGSGYRLLAGPKGSADENGHSDSDQDDQHA